ncbi:FAD-dependent oxidoreductase [Candidatus Bathyarchaeota archaeon]|nr:FAD-dependent oxidoreductase [Candidatus Bathyarchaeota archaeon]
MVLLEPSETGTVNEQRVTDESLMPKVREMKDRGARFITITTRDMGDTLEVIYHFEVGDHVENIYLETGKDKPVQSITGEYLVAFIAENECRDLFGVEFEKLAVDLGGKMLKVESSPSTLLKPAVGPQPPIMRKLGRCREECPAMVNIPRYIRQVEQGDVEGAYNTIIDRAPLPAILGRVCFAPCQEGCRQEHETKPIQIRLLKRYAADGFREQNGSLLRTVERSPSTGKRVAVIGGGPAGVSAAYYLGMLGHIVTLLEKGKTLGGAMLWGIPKYRLPKDILKEELYARLAEADVDVRTGVEVTSLEDLMAEGYDACFIGIGAEKCNSLRCEGETSEGVISFIDLLTAVNVRDETPDLGRRVVVIGGGNSAMDSARTARRLGAEEVTVFYRRTEDEMPASLHEIHGAVEEGIDFDFLSTQLTIHPGKPLRIDYQYMEPGEPDESGRRRPVPMEGKSGSLEADTVVSAIGYNVVVPPGFDVEVNRRGVIVIDEDYRTSRDGVYAGGDAAFGTSSVIAAIRDARKAASSIDMYLGGEGLSEPEPDMSEYVQRQVDLDEIRARHQAEIPEMEAGERVQSFAEFEMRLEKCSATCEAGRCWRCDWNE